MRALLSAFTKVRQHPALTVLILSLVVVIGLSLYVPCRLLWAKYQFHAAKEALEHQHFEQARQHLVNYLAVWPNSVSGHLLLARTARRAGFADEAERQLDICDRLEGGRDTTDLERTLLKVEQGDLSLEESLWARLDQDRNEAILILEALTKGYRKYYLLRKMLKGLDALLERQPNNVYAWIEKGWVHERQFYYRLSIEDYRKALECDPKNEMAQLALAQGLLQLGEPLEALAYFRQLRQSQPNDPKISLGQALCLHKLGQTEKALRLLDEMAERFPNEANILLERGKLALETGHRSEAESWLRKAVAKAPDDYQANYTLLMCLNAGRSKAERQKYKRRVQRIEVDVKRMHQLTDLLQSQPQNPRLRCEIGRIFMRNGAPTQGLRWLKSALQIDPTHSDTHKTLAAYYEKNHQVVLAERHRRLSRGAGTNRGKYSDIQLKENGANNE